MLVYAPNAELGCFYSNRLLLLADSYEKSEETVDFFQYKSLDEIVGKLLELESQDLHLEGTRGYVYHSGRMANVVKTFKKNVEFDTIYLPATLLTRTGGLRWAVLKLLG